MSLLIVLPSENTLLSTRRLDDKADQKPITHALDSDVFYYLCRYTDWASGIIGKHSALSYSRIASALSEDIPRKPSRSLRTVNRNDVRNSVKRLRRIGVLSSESITNEKQHQLILHRVFWQHLLTAPHCQTNPDTRQLSGFIVEISKFKLMNNSDLEENNTEKNVHSNASDATYNKPINITNAESSKFQMLLTWQYDEDLVELFLQAAGFTRKQIKQVWFGKYVQYWSGESIQRTQREWSLHFANHMQGYLLRPDFFEQVNGMLEDNQPSKARNRRDKACLVSTTTVPRLSDGEQLQTWALAHDLPAAPVGMDTMQYYQFLCGAIKQHGAK